MVRRPPRSTRPDPLVPDPTLVRSPRIATLDDPFEGFARWQAQFAGNTRRHWREDLGARVEPDPSYAGPRLIRALEALRQISRSEEHTSELQSLMRISYAVFCLKKKTTNTHQGMQ